MLRSFKRQCKTGPNPSKWLPMSITSTVRRQKEHAQDSGKQPRSKENWGVWCHTPNKEESFRKTGMATTSNDTVEPKSGIGR